MPAPSDPSPMVGELNEYKPPTAGWRPVAADLAAPWDHHLLSAGFHPRSPTLWTAEGLLFYLTHAQMHETLSLAANLSQDRAVLAADIFGTGLLDALNALLDGHPHKAVGTIEVLEVLPQPGM